MLEFLFRWLLKTGLNCVLRYLFWACKCTAKKKACRFHFCLCNLSSPFAQYPNKKLSSSWAIICYVLLSMELYSYQPLLDICSTVLLLCLDRRQMKLTRSILVQTQFLFSFISLCIVWICWEFSAKGLLWYEMLPKVNTDLRKCFNVGIWFIWKVPTQFTTVFLMTVAASHSL